MEQGSLGQWLEERCREEGLSLRQAGAKTGLSHSTIAEIMKGVSVSAETVRKLARGFGGNGEHGLVLEDKILILAGYKTPRPGKDAPNEQVAQLVDQLSQFDEHQLKLVRHFVTFISEMEAK